MQVDEAIRSLRARRRFGLEHIPDDLVRRWVDAARWCGSSKNTQPWRFVAVRDRETLRSLSTLGDFASHLTECDVAIVLVAVPTAYPFSAAFDLGRVAQSLMLLARADEVDSCVAVFGPQENVVTAGGLVGVPPQLSAELAIAFGYPAPDEAVGDRQQTKVSPRGRRVTHELLHWERFSGVASDALR